MNNRRIVNIRILFVALVGIISGILFAYLVIKSVNLHSFNLYLIPIIILLCCDILWILCKLYKGNNNFLLYLQKHFASSIAFVLMFAVGAGTMTLKLVNYLRLTDYTQEYQISINVDDVYVHTSYATLTASKFKVDGQTINQSTTLTIYFDSSVEQIGIKAGDNISFSSNVRLTPLFDDNSNLVDYLYGRAYSMSVDYDDVSVNGKVFVLDKAVRTHVYNQLVSNMSEDNAGISYAMLFGGKEHLDSQNKQMFSYAGISHILAVSGLHVTVVAGMIAWLLKKLRLNRWAIMSVSAILLLIYCYLCGFSPSVVRASIMSVIVLGALSSGKEYDILSALSLAAIITLSINPLNLFASGFQMSYLCVLCIITLSNSISRALAKLHLPKIVCNTIAISTCINMVILPVNANSFGQVSMVGCLANVVILPLFSVVFPLLYICAILSAIMPFMGFVLILPNILLHGLKIVANFFAGISFLNLKLFNLSYLILLGIILLLLVIKYLMVRLRLKAIICTLILGVIVTSFALSCISNTYDNVYATSYQYSTNSCVITIDGYNYLVGTKNKNTESMLKKLKIRTIDYIICYDLNLNNMDNIIEFAHQYNTKGLILPNNFNELWIKDRGISYILTNRYIVGNSNFEFRYNNRGGCIGLLSMADKNILFANCGNTQEENLYLINNLDVHIDYIVYNMINIGTTVFDDDTSIVVHNGADNDRVTNIYNIDKYLIG